MPRSDTKTARTPRSFWQLRPGTRPYLDAASKVRPRPGLDREAVGQIARVCSITAAPKTDPMPGQNQNPSPETPTGEPTPTGAGRSVTVGGSVKDSLVITGDGNAVLQFAVADPAAVHQVLGKVLPSSLHQLPPAPGDFKGRKAEISDLGAIMENGGAAQLLIRGMGGVGKTSLALKIAEQLTPRYPDAQLFLDLRGMSQQPLAPAEAMAHVVRSWHPTVNLPDNESDLRGAYQSVLHNKRVL